MQTRDFDELWKRPELFEVPEVSDGSKYFSAGANGPRPLLLHARSVNGREYTAAAYYGVPKGEPPFPAVILFHGGGGTAFPQYVKKWNRYGYAALIFDHYGKLPVCDLIQYDRPHVPGSWLDAEGIPSLNADTTTSPLESLALWVGNAVSLAIAANSYLRSRPEVDKEHIGLLGLSWGGLMGGIVAAYDERLDFAALIYGCGFNRLSEPEVLFSKFGGEPWEPEHFLHMAKLPLCWIGGADDPFFSPRSWSASVLAAPGSVASALIPGLGHSHDGFLNPLFRRFADIRRGAAPALPRLGETELNDGVISAPILSAGQGKLRPEVVFTCDKCPSPERKWLRAGARIADGRVYAEVPKSCAACFLDVLDDALETPEALRQPASSSCLYMD